MWQTGLALPVGLVLGGFGVFLLLVAIIVMLVAVGRFQPAMATAAAGDSPITPGSYPVRLDAALDPGLSRWMWLVKWFLAIPHLIVIALLWLAVIPLTVVAGVAILFTGRYPRAIFEFNVGVLRWTWRVEYYAFYVLGTDRYPPFSLHSDPNYPADLAIDYPHRLSRGLVLVKWWLLAIPHYIVVALFTGGWLGWSVGYGDDSRFTASFSLIGILVIVAVVILAFTGRYPQPLFDFVMGMNRWCYRVLGYVMLMRDEYPPFRLDSGGTDPGRLPQPPPPDRTGEPAGDTDRNVQQREHALAQGADDELRPTRWSPSPGPPLPRSPFWPWLSPSTACSICPAATFGTCPSGRGRCCVWCRFRSVASCICWLERYIDDHQDHRTGEAVRRSRGTRGRRPGGVRRVRLRPGRAERRR